MTKLLKLLAPDERIVGFVADIHHRPRPRDSQVTLLLGSAGERERVAVACRAVSRDAGRGCQRGMAIPAVPVPLVAEGREVDRTLGSVVCSHTRIALIAADGAHRGVRRPELAGCACTPRVGPRTLTKRPVYRMIRAV